MYNIVEFYEVLNSICLPNNFCVGTYVGYILSKKYKNHN